MPLGQYNVTETLQHKAALKQCKTLWDKTEQEVQSECAWGSKAGQGLSWKKQKTISSLRAKVYFPAHHTGTAPKLQRRKNKTKQVSVKNC